MTTYMYIQHYLRYVVSSSVTHFGTRAFAVAGPIGQRHVFYFYFYEILVAARLGTCFSS